MQYGLGPHLITLGQQTTEELLRLSPGPGSPSLNFRCHVIKRFAVHDTWIVQFAFVEGSTEVVVEIGPENSARRLIQFKLEVEDKLGPLRLQLAIRRQCKV